MKRKQGSGQRQYKKENNSMDRGRLEGGKKNKKEKGGRKEDEGEQMEDKRNVS